MNDPTFRKENARYALLIAAAEDYPRLWAIYRQACEEERDDRFDPTRNHHPEGV